MAHDRQLHGALRLLSALEFDGGEKCREHLCTTEVLAELSKHLEDLPSDEAWRFLMISMPELDKLLCSWLNHGRIAYSQVSESLEVPFVILSRVIEGIFSVTDELGRYDADLIFWARTLLCMFKKVNRPCSKRATEDAIDEFILIDSTLREPSNPWGSVWTNPVCGLSFTDGCSAEDKEILETLDRVSGRTSPGRAFDYRDVVPKHGPGSVADKRRGEDKYNFTSTWPALLQEQFPEEYFCTPWGDLVPSTDYDICISARTEQSPSIRYALYLNGCTSLSRERSVPSVQARLVGVPKTLKGPRLITVEPTAHQFIQQGLMGWLRDSMSRAHRTCVTFDNQQLSKDLAREASISGELATVDLSSASDRLSCWTVERSFRNVQFLQALNACRTHTVQVRNTTLELRKFAGMGSAVTFPVQSLIYANIAISAVLLSEGKRVSTSSIMDAARRVRVFGDDIIVPVDALPVLRRLLGALQLKVNELKTHSCGHFRESCGGDYYNGYTVNPVYLSEVSFHSVGKKKCKPEALAAWVETSNNAYKAGLWRLSATMVEMLGHMSKQLVTRSHYESPDCISLYSFSQRSGSLPARRVRYNGDLHRFEVRALALVTNMTKRSRGTAEDLLQYYLEKEPGPSTNAQYERNAWQPGHLLRASSNLRRTWVSL